MATSMNYSLDVIARVLKKWEAAYKNCQCTDIQKLVKEALFESDFTRFKVTATDTYKEDKFALRTTVRKADMDVVIDWGDGTKDVIKDTDFQEDLKQWQDSGQVILPVKHTYATAGDYDVTIYGKDYFCVSRGPKYNGYTKQDAATCAEMHGLISECFTAKYPVAQCVTNLSWFAACSDMLESVFIPTSMEFSRVDNISCLFQGSTKLKKVQNIKYKFHQVKSSYGVFKYCSSLQHTDYVFPSCTQYQNNASGVFEGCTSLTDNVASFFGRAGLITGNVCTMVNTFLNTKVTGTVPASQLWQRTDVTWKNTTYCFAGCPADILAQVPKTWGGTKA